MISYCIAAYRPIYARLLIAELAHKTTAPYEILLWLNVADPDFESFLGELAASGVPLRVVGRSAENIGMEAYPRLFSACRFDMIAQIDDDVVCISPFLAERACETFARFRNAGMLTADTWQDEYTNGARPPMDAYRQFDEEFGLFDGPIDGWFAIYRKSSLRKCRKMRIGRYFALGSAIKRQLQCFGQSAFLSARIKVFHVTGPQYASYFGMLESEIEKYASLGLQNLVECYKSQKIPSLEYLSERIGHIRSSFERPV